MGMCLTPRGISLQAGPSKVTEHRWARAAAVRSAMRATPLGSGGKVSVTRRTFRRSGTTRPELVFPGAMALVMQSIVYIYR